MPILRLVSNADATEPVRARLLRDLSAAAASGLGKPPEKVMAFIRHDPELIFGGSTEPAGFLEVMSLGYPERDAMEKLTADLSALLDEVLGLPPARVFIRFDELEADRLAIGGALRG